MSNQPTNGLSPFIEVCEPLFAILPEEDREPARTQLLVAATSINQQLLKLVGSKRKRLKKPVSECYPTHSDAMVVSTVEANATDLASEYFDRIIAAALRNSLGPGALNRFFRDDAVIDGMWHAMTSALPGVKTRRRDSKDQFRRYFKARLSDGRRGLEERAWRLHLHRIRSSQIFSGVEPDEVENLANACRAERARIELPVRFEWYATEGHEHLGKYYLRSNADDPAIGPAAFRAAASRIGQVLNLNVYTPDGTRGGNDRSLLLPR